MKYQHTKNGTVANLIESNEKFKTVLLEYEDGTTHNISTSTLKRWWKEMDDDVAGDGTPFSDVMKEIISDEEYIKEVMDAKKEAGVEIMDLDPNDVEIVEPKKTRKKEITPNTVVDEAMSYIDKLIEYTNLTYSIREKQPYLRNYKINGEGIVVFNIATSSKSVRINLKSKDVVNGLDISKFKKINHCFDLCYIIKKQFTQDDIKVIDDIIDNYSNIENYASKGEN